MDGQDSVDTIFRSYWIFWVIRALLVYRTFSKAEYQFGMPQSAYQHLRGGILWSVRRHLQQVGDITISERVSSSDEIYDPQAVDEPLAVDVSPAVKVLPAGWMIGARQAFFSCPLVLLPLAVLNPGRLSDPACTLAAQGSFNEQ